VGQLVEFTSRFNEAAKRVATFFFILKKSIAFTVMEFNKKVAFYLVCTASHSAGNGRT
jgi:mannitol/fructose-specific phosphotransferase system IIA component (Ntr-type)